MSRDNRPRRLVGRQDQGGQGLVEMALVLPVFLLVLFGVFDAGRLVYTNTVLSQAAREGARVGAAEAGWIGVPGPACVDSAGDIGLANPGAHVCPPDVGAFVADITDAVNGMAVSLGPITAVHLSCNDGSTDDPLPTGAWTQGGLGNGCLSPEGTAIGSVGDFLSVRVEYEYEPITPIIGSILGKIWLSGSASMSIN
jgi:hypothetical protein